MEFSEEWKTNMSISLNAPLLLSNPCLGPLFFQPIPHTLIHFLTSPSLTPVPSSLPHLSLSRFLHTTSSPFPSFVAPSLSSSISHSLSQDDPLFESSLPASTNYLELLHCKFNNSVLVFFPTGENADQVGFIELIVLDSNISVLVDSSSSKPIYMSKEKFNNKIVKILVNALNIKDNGLLKGNSDIVFAYLLVFTMYSVHWFCVKSNGHVDSRPRLVYLNSKIFKGCAIVNACWNPHLPKQAVVLLESGELFLFNLKNNPSSNSKFQCSRLSVSFGDSQSSKNQKWLGCHFSWHSEILIVASSEAVFLVDFRSRVCKVDCVANVNILIEKRFVENTDQFIAYSKAGGIEDGYYFTLVSNRRLLLYDIRKPMIPVLQWDHSLDDPYYVKVYNLSDLRSNSIDNKYNYVSESGFCIIVGSFWNCEFQIFCYGSSLSALNGLKNFYKPLYAWDLPSKLSLSGCECHCGNCFSREESFKNSLPEWIYWQQKKEITLGFGILDKNFSRMFSQTENFGGFTLIRLLSSGKLELQKYCASWNVQSEFKHAHQNSLMDYKNYFLSYEDDVEYKFPKRFKYLQLDYLNTFLNGNLPSVLKSSINKLCKGHEERDFDIDLHKMLCEKLKTCGVIQSTSPLISIVLKDTGLPTSFHELAMKRMWTGLPVTTIQLAFSNYSEILDVVVDDKITSLEFLSVPDQPQLPPFLLRKPFDRSNKWSQKVPRGDDLVGPVLPLPVLFALNEIHCNASNFQEKYETKQFETQVSMHCNEVKNVACDFAGFDSGYDVVSLGDDREKPWGGDGSQESKDFLLYKQDESDYKDEKFDSLIARLQKNDPLPKDKNESVGIELFNDLCPVEMNFGAHDLKLEGKELMSLKLLKMQFSRWQEGFDLYRDFSKTTK